jgi:hypothetical protein
VRLHDSPEASASNAIAPDALAFNRSTVSGADIRNFLFVWLTAGANPKKIAREENQIVQAAVERRGRPQQSAPIIAAQTPTRSAPAPLLAFPPCAPIRSVVDGSHARTNAAGATVANA